jgi:hypothetical protein
MVDLTVAEAGWFHSAVDRLTQPAEYQPDFDPRLSRMAISPESHDYNARLVWNEGQRGDGR